MSHKKDLNDRFHKKDLAVSKWRLFFISPKRECIILDWCMFVVVVKLSLLLHNVSTLYVKNIFWKKLNILVETNLPYFL